MPTNNTIVAGTTGNFQATPVPAGSQPPANAQYTWTASDSSVVLTPNGLQCAAAVPTGDTNPNFTLSLAGTGSDANGNPWTANGQATVTIQQPENLPTSFDITQTS